METYNLPSQSTSTNNASRDDEEEQHKEKVQTRPSCLLPPAPLAWPQLGLLALVLPFSISSKVACSGPILALESNLNSYYTILLLN